MLRSNIKLSTIAIVWLCFKSFALSQTPEIDSLYHLMEKADVQEKLELYHEIYMLAFHSAPESSLEIANQATNLAIRTNNKESLIILYQDKSRSHLCKYEYDSAFFYASKGKEIAQNMGQDRSVASCIELQGCVFFEKADFETASDYFLQSSEMFESIGDSNRIAGVYSRLGLLLCSTGDYNKANEYWSQAYELIDSSMYPVNVAICLNYLGFIHQEWGDRAVALNYYQRALEINRELGSKRSISSCLFNIGDLFFKESNYTKALNYYRQSLQVSVGIEDQYGIGASYIGLCDAFEELLQPDSVFYYADRTEKIFIEIGNEQGLALAYFHKGEGFFIKKDYHNAIKEYQKSVDLSKKINDKQALSEALSGLGISFYELGDFKIALKKFLEAVSLAEESNLIDDMLENYKYIADCYSKQNAKSEESGFLRKYITLKDSVYTLESEKTASELLVKYEVEKTEAELKTQTKEKVVNENKLARQRLLTLAVGIVLLLFIIIVILLYNRYRQNKKTNDLLNAQSLEIKQKQKKIERQNQKLGEQAKSLQEIDELKSRFYSNISHEFRTPLSLIIGPLESIIPKIRNKHLKYQLELMLRNANKVLALINQILVLSKIDKGVLKVKLQYGDINKEAEYITELFSSYAKEKKVELIYKKADNAIDGYFDKEKLEKVLNNLISNAIKNTEKGKVVVGIKTKGKGEIEVKVQDTGQGIAPEDLPHIFERFYMVESKNISEYIGSGIGLAFTKELVQLLKGSIHVESEINKGSTFTVALPIVQSVFSKDEYTLVDEEGESSKHIRKSLNSEPIDTEYMDKPQNEEVPVLSNNAERTSSLPATILVVEDHEELRGFISNSLSDTYRVLQAQNGEEGVEKALANQPDIIVTDITMPKVDGMELTKTLKTNKETSHIPIVILTAKASFENKMEGLKNHADDYLCKPFNIEELKTRIGNLLVIRQRLREKYIRSIEVNPSEITSNSIDEQLISQALKAVEENMANPDFSVEMLCNILGISRSKLHSKLKSLLNQSATEFINTIRVKRAAQLIGQHAGSISEIAYNIGFNNLSYFSKTFKKHFNVTPSEMLQKHS